MINERRQEKFGLGATLGSGCSLKEESARLDIKYIGKPCTRKLCARFDEGGQGYLLSTLASVTGPYWPVVVAAKKSS